MLWIFFTIAIISFTYLGQKMSGWRGLLAKGLLLCTLSAMTGFGAVVGEDHDNYAEMFRSYTSFSEITNVENILANYMIEPGYIILSVLANSFNVQEPYFFFILSLLMNLCVVFLVFKFKHPVLGILLFVLSINYIQQVNLARQCIAISFYAISVYYLIEKKYWRHIGLLFLAFMFHATAIICLPFSLLALINYQKWKDACFYTALVGWLVSVMVFLGIMDLPFLGSLNSMFGESRFSSYADGRNTMGLAKVGFNYVYNLMFFFVLISLRTRIDFYKVLIILGVIFLNFNAPFTNRFALYFILFIPLTCGEYIERSTYKLTRQFAGIIPVYRTLFIIYWSYRLFSSNIIGTPLIGSAFY